MNASEKELFDSTLDLVVFFDILSGDVHKLIDYLAKDLEKSCLDNPSLEVLHSGSGFEGLSLPHIDQESQFSTWNTDADHMIIRKDIEILEGRRRQGTAVRKEVESLENTGEENAGITKYIYEGGHKGYVYVASEELQNPVDPACVPEHCMKNIEFIENNKSFVRVRHAALMSSERAIQGPSQCYFHQQGTFSMDRDIVYSLQCKSWPSQASEWVTRERLHSWPPAELISAIVSKGCHVVPVGSHTSSLRDFEWRISFSLAELMLIRPLKKDRKLAYSIAKALIKSEKKHREMSVFSSYHLKTTLLWLLERKGIACWMQRSLGENILELIDFLIGFYADGQLPNYFIPQNNMIDHRSSDEISATSNALIAIKESITWSLCRYIETNQALPVFFDKPLTSLLLECPEKFIQICKYNFLLMTLTEILKCLKSAGEPALKASKAGYLFNKAQLMHKAGKQSDHYDHRDGKPNAKTVLSTLEDFLAQDQLKVTESSAVTLAVFNVFLALHPTTIDETTKRGSPEFYDYLTIPEFKDCLFWAGRQHEKYSDAIYDFVVEKWISGPSFYTEDGDARVVMKLLMVVLGKPTKQASAVTGSLVKRSVEGNRFLIMRSLADYLLVVHPESAYVAFQAAAYLMDKPVISEINNFVKHGVKRAKLRAIELILGKAELQAQVSEEEFNELIQMQHELAEPTF